MNVAVIGAGYAGLSVCWHLLQFPSIKVALYDEGSSSIGSSSASRASTGLLHPFPGRTSSRSWMSKEGMEESLKLITVAEQALGKSVANRAGIRRLPWAPWQEKEFLKASKKDSDLLWEDGSLFIPSGVAVFSKSYMGGLLKACLAKGAILIQERVNRLKSIGADHIVLATGAGISRLYEVPLIPVKGHSLVCRIGDDRLTTSLICNGHITPMEDPELCMIGSTYEHEFANANPEPSFIPHLLAKAAAFYPPAKDFKAVELLAGIRMTQKEGYRPYVERVSPSMHVFSGLGSRGLLYHALLGKQIAHEIAQLLLS